MGITFSMFFLALVISLAASAQTESRVKEIVICKSPGKTDGSASAGNSAGKSVRTLRVYETKEKNESGEAVEGCRATYSKTNGEQTVGSSRQVQQCQSILHGIQKNLEASHWSCRRAGSMAVLKSTAAESSEAAVSADARPKPATPPSESIVR